MNKLLITNMLRNVLQMYTDTWENILYLYIVSREKALKVHKASTSREW